MSPTKIMSGVVILIGIYMIAMNMSGGLLIPPVLSGAAFVLLGAMHCMKK